MLKFTLLFAALLALFAVALAAPTQEAFEDSMDDFEDGDLAADFMAPGPKINITLPAKPSSHNHDGDDEDEERSSAIAHIEATKIQAARRAARRQFEQADKQGAAATLWTAAPKRHLRQRRL